MNNPLFFLIWWKDESAYRNNRKIRSELNVNESAYTNKGIRSICDRNESAYTIMWNYVKESETLDTKKVNSEIKLCEIMWLIKSVDIVKYLCYNRSIRKGGHKIWLKKK